jgi:hypothetical protein
MGEQPNQAKSIFLEAIEEHAPEQWPAFLEQACAGDVQLRAEVAKLLRAQADLGSLHEASRATLLAAVAAPLAERPGTAIGPYRLLEQLGEGGFGVVFLAEQRDPIRPTVALKILKPGMDTKQILARFEAERQTLALMDHPHITRVLDAGVTDSAAVFRHGVGQGVTDHRVLRPEPPATPSSTPTTRGSFTATSSRRTSR